MRAYDARPTPSHPKNTMIRLSDNTISCIDPIKNSIKNQYRVRSLSPCIYPVEYTNIRNEIQATKLVITTDSGSAKTPDFTLSTGIQGIWLCISFPDNANGIKVAAEIALASARPTA